jgi:hypothetical protein
MNDYDRLPGGIKTVQFLAQIAPPIAAGILNRSWTDAAIVFLGGSLFLSFLVLRVFGEIVRKRHMLPNGEIDAGPVRRAMMWPFLLSGPLCGALVALFVIN